MSAEDMQDQERQTDSSESRKAAAKKTQIVIEEARMVVPGLQALFGFQMIAVFNQRFAELPDVDKLLHLTAVFLTVLSIASIMTPAAYHRIAEPELGSEHFVGFASRLVAGAMAPLALSLTLDVYVVARIILENVAASVTIAAVLGLVLAGSWFAYPLAELARKPPR